MIKKIKQITAPVQIKRVGDGLHSDNWIKSGEASKAMRQLLEDQSG